MGSQKFWGRNGRLAIIGTSIAMAVMAVLPAASPVAASASAAPKGGTLVGSGADQARITRDSYGVPTITSQTTAGMWFGSGWAQAQDRMVQLELTRRAVEGKLSQILGPAELSQDETVRTLFYTPAELKQQYNSLDPTAQAALQAFSQGINAYEKAAYASPASEQADVPYEFFVLGQLLGESGPYQPAPWQPTDTVAVGDYLARQFGGGGGSELQNLQFANYLELLMLSRHDHNPTTDATSIFNDARWLDDPTAPTTVPGHHAAVLAAGSPASTKAADLSVERTLARLSFIPSKALTNAYDAVTRDKNNILQTGISLRVLSHGGSNAIAIAPKRGANGHALLWGAPQEGFGTPSVDGEEYLHGPGYDAGGMYITGEPFLLIGRNGQIAWTTTSEELVDTRIYVENVNFAADPPTYNWDGQQIPMKALKEQIPVAGQAPVRYTVYRTKDGPVVNTDTADGLAFSVRFASWMRETGSLEGFSQLGSDENLKQFRHSMSLITTLHNFLYADNQGNIAYFGDGLIPIEPSFASVDPRLPALGNGTEQWTGFVPFNQMPHSINPGQGYLDNWNTKPSQQAFYQQNEGDEYWGTIFRSSLISQMAQHNHITIAYLEKIEHAIGTIDNGDNTRPAAPYFIPYLTAAYNALRAQHSPLTNPQTHPDLIPAIRDLTKWNDVSTLGSPAMSIFMNFLEALERNVFEGGTFSGEQYTGSVNFSDAALGAGTYGGLGGMGTYNFLYHILAGTQGLVPCGTLCYTTHNYFGGHENQVLVESLNDAITILSGTGTQLGQNVPGFGTTDVSKWGYEPAQDQNWDSLDPLAVGVTTSCGTSASQNRSTFMMAVDVGPKELTGQDVLPPGQSAFISSAGVPSPNFCDQVGLFNSFTYKNMPTTHNG